MSANLAVIYTTGTDAVAQAFADAASGLGAEVRVLWVPSDERHEHSSSHPTVTFDDVRWADGTAFGTPIGDGHPAEALMRFIQGMKPLWASGWLADKVVTMFTDRPERIAPDSVLHPVYDALYQWGAVIVGPRAIELNIVGGPSPASAGSVTSPLPAARLRTAQYRAVRFTRLAGVIADERHRREQLER